MLRLSLLRFTLLATSILFSASGSAGQDQNSSVGNGNCRCLYGDSCWPTESDFAELSSQLSQPLVHPVPPESACYPSHGTTSATGDCVTVQANTANGTWRADQPGTYQIVNFEKYVFPNGSISGCFLDPTLGFPCEQGNVPPIGVDARSVEDVQAAVKFVVEKNLRLVIKNTGHDYLGRSSAKDGFMIWTHHMKSIVYNDAFTPQGAPETERYQALTIGAGVQWHEAYSAAQQNNRFIVGGLSPDGSVGAAGGWIGGGGHSAFAPRYGLGVDNAIQFTIVTTNGDHLTVNAYSHSDLFWALRGGGPGTYGVVTSVTYKTHDIEPLAVSFIAINFTSLDQVNATVGQSFLEHAKSVAGENNTQMSVFSAPSFYDVVGRTSSTQLAPGHQIGVSLEMASRLYSRDVFEMRPDELAETLLNLPGGRGNSIAHVAGGAVSQIDPDSVGLNPAWRNAVALVYDNVAWEEDASAQEIQARKDTLKQHIDILERLEPGAGSYVNEGSLYEPNRQSTYFGDHYNRLLEIKEQYDPKGVFVVASGVGSENWDENLVCRRGQRRLFRRFVHR